MTFKTARRLSLIEQVIPPVISYNIDFLKKKVYFQAKGQIAKLIIYRYNGRFGRQDVYGYILGENPKTELQQANRMKFQAAMAAWKVLSDEEKAFYEYRVINRKMCGKNLFVKEYMKDLI